MGHEPLYLMSDRLKDTDGKHYFDTLFFFLKPAFACPPPPAPPHWVGREPDEAQDDVPIPASHPRPRHQTSLGLRLTSRCLNTVLLSHVVYVMPFMNCGRKQFYVARRVHVQCVKRFLFSTSWK